MTTPPVLRADAARNRSSLLAVATRVFATSGEPPSMRAIAREAGVGIGTLYRHFPTREALLDAVYQDQADRLTQGARELLAAHPPAEATRRWMDLFGDWLATKHGMVGALSPSPAAPTELHARSRARMLAAVVDLLEAGHAAGDIRPDVTAEDLVAHLVGIFTVAGDHAHRAQAARLLDVLMDGLRPQATHG